MDVFLNYSLDCKGGLRPRFSKSPEAPEILLARRQILKSKLVEWGHSQSHKPVVSLTDSFIVSLKV